MLRAEERRQRPVAGGEAIGGVDDAAVDRGGIAHEADALPGDQLAIGTVEQSFEAEADGHPPIIVVRLRAGRRALDRIRWRAIAAPHSASANELQRKRCPASSCALLKTKSRSRPDWITSRVACQGSAGVRDPPANTARVDVSRSRPVGCAGSSGMETGALKWHPSAPTTRWLVSTTGHPRRGQLPLELEQLLERVEHLLFDLEVVRQRRRGAERRLQRRRRAAASRAATALVHASRHSRAPSLSSAPFLPQPAEEFHRRFCPFTSDSQRSLALALQDVIPAFAQSSLAAPPQDLWIECRNDCPWSSPSQ